MGCNNIMCFVNSIVINRTICHRIYAKKYIHNLENSVSFPVIPNVRLSVTCDVNENCYTSKVNHAGCGYGSDISYNNGSFSVYNSLVTYCPYPAMYLNKEQAFARKRTTIDVYGLCLELFLEIPIVHIILYCILYPIFL